MISKLLENQDCHASYQYLRHRAFRTIEVSVIVRERTY